ncbi:MAG: type II secretion system F family protein [Eubacterium sp.]|nr:type II secretion system F family protein [Eubacterium sp.]
MLDYKKYKMNMGERLIGYVIGAIIVGIVTYLFFWNYKVTLILAAIGGIAGIKVYKSNLLEKRNRKILRQFRDFLDGLDGAISSGNVVYDALKNTYNQLCNNYGKDSYISIEVQRMIQGMQNGGQLVDFIYDFAERSGLEDITSFADVFSATLSRGGNTREAIAYSRKSLVEKIEAEANIKNRLEGGKQELRIMMILPLIVLVMTSESNISMGGNLRFFVIKCFVMAMYIAAYFIGRKLLNVKI